MSNPIIQGLLNAKPAQPNRNVELYDKVIHQLMNDLYDPNHKEMAFRLLDNIPEMKLKEYMKGVK